MVRARPTCTERTSTEPKIAAATTAAVPPPAESRVPVIGLIHSPDVAARSNNAPVAVCMARQLRTFLDPEVQIGYSEQLHYKGYEYFLSTDQYISFYDPRPRVKLQSIYVSESARPPTTACPPHTTNHRFLLPMASRLSHCSLSFKPKKVWEQFGTPLSCVHGPISLFLSAYRHWIRCLQHQRQKEQNWHSRTMHWALQLARTRPPCFWCHRLRTRFVLAASSGPTPANGQSSLRRRNPKMSHAVR